MSTYFVTYTLKDSTDYTKLSKRLKKYPNWAKLFARAWIINTSHSSKKVRDELVEAIEAKDHPFFVGVQYHPEFKSRPNRPHPIFEGFIQASLQNQD